MTRIIALALAIALGTVAQASDDDMKLDTGISDAIKARLTEQGYDVRKVEVEDGMYEAYALKDGERYEIYLNAALDIVKTERDD